MYDVKTLSKITLVIPMINKDEMSMVIIKLIVYTIFTIPGFISIIIVLQ
jgi:hypothetical protein